MFITFTYSEMGYCIHRESSWFLILIIWILKARENVIVGALEYQKPVT